MRVWRTPGCERTGRTVLLSMVTICGVYQPALTMRLHHFVAGREASRARARNFLFFIIFFSSEQQLRGPHRGMPRSLRAALGATHASHHPTAAIINPAELHGQCVNYSRSALARVRKCAVPYTSLARVCVHARVIHRMRAESNEFR